MPRRKVPIGLIGNRRTRAVTFAKRKEGLKKKARELATLCGVPVAVVVCAGPDGGAPDVWASEDGVIERYRALPRDKRAGHTHLSYLRDQLGKEKAKLARQRQDGPDELAPPDSVLNGMALHELQQMLDSLDAKLRAKEERRKALGLPDHWHDVPCTGSNPVVSDGYQVQPWHNVEYAGGVMQPWHNAQYVGGNGADMNGYQHQQQMPWNGSNGAWGAIQPCNAMVQPGHGGFFQCTDQNGVVYTAGGHQQMQFPDSGGWHNPAMWATDEPCHAMVPAGYPDMHIGGNSMEYPTSAIGDNFVDEDEQVQFLTMGADDNGSFVMDADVYATKCSTNELQSSEASQNSSSLEQLHYLSDVTDGHYFGSSDNLLDLWVN